MKKLLVLLLLSLKITTAFAESILNADYACFSSGDSLTYVEIYSSVQRIGLQRNPDDSTKADFDVVVNISDSFSVVISDTFSAQDVVSAQGEVSAGQFFPQVFRFLLRPGTYPLTLVLLQSGSERDRIEDDLQIKHFEPEKHELSDIELGSDLKYVSEKSSFVKNSLRVLPNPSGLFGTRMPVVYYYLEVYGIPVDTLNQDSVVVFRKIISAENNLSAKPTTQKSYLVKVSNLVVSDGFPVSTLRTGTYILQVDILYPLSSKIVSAKKKFWIHRPEDLAHADFAKQSSQDIQDHSNGPTYITNILEVIKPDSALDLMKYLFTSDESAQIKRLNSDGKKEFFYNYWREREVKEANAANKYFARVIEANNRYSYLKKNGWKTDRGRVFIMYGEPDNYSRNYLETSDLDNEVWNYDRLEGGVVFVFKDVNGFGDLELVHSTKRGEISNPKWFDSSQSNRFNNSSDITR